MRSHRYLALLPALLLTACFTDFPESLLGEAGPDAPAADADADVTVPDSTPPPDLPPPDTKPLPPSLANGEACTVDTACFSGHCADGVCCDSACTASCETCNLNGKEGQCLPVPRGGKPTSGKSCSTTSATSCGNDGTCDGLGSCRRWPQGTICADQACVGGGSDDLKLARFCDGQGQCADLLAGSAAQQSCAPYACDNAACRTSCNNKNHCSSGGDCNKGSCGLAPIGAACTADAQCASGFCADGTCCQSACADTCKTCALEGARGWCVNVPAASKPPAGKSCATSPPCGTDGRCDGLGFCRVTPQGTPCGTPSCTDGGDAGSGPAQRRSVCNGSTTAPACEEQVDSCGDYACQPDGVSCYGRCADSSHCAPGKTCGNDFTCS